MAKSKEDCLEDIDHRLIRVRVGRRKMGSKTSRRKFQEFGKVFFFNLVFVHPRFIQLFLFKLLLPLVHPIAMGVIVSFLDTTMHL